jgi:hypothetical protein
VRAGSIVPLGSPVESTHQQQSIASVRVYPGADSDFSLFADDGTTYSYEKGGGSITGLHWREATHEFTHDGVGAWTTPDKSVVEIVGK